VTSQQEKLNGEGFWTNTRIRWANKHDMVGPIRVLLEILVDHQACSGKWEA